MSCTSTTRTIGSLLPNTDRASNASGMWSRRQGRTSLKSPDSRLRGVPIPLALNLGTCIEEVGEENDTMAEATPIGEGHHVGYFCEPDIADFYSFEASAGQQIRINAGTNWTSNPSHCLLLFDPDGIDVTGDDSANEPRACTIGRVNITAGKTGTYVFQLLPSFDVSQDVLSYEFDLSVAGIGLMETSATEGLLVPGARWSFVATATNPGPDVMSDLTVVDTYSEQTSVVPGSISPSTCVDDGVNHQVACQNFVLASGDSFVLSFAVELGEDLFGADTLFNHVTAMASTGEGSQTATAGSFLHVQCSGGYGSENDDRRTFATPVDGIDPVSAPATIASSSPVLADRATERPSSTSSAARETTRSSEPKGSRSSKEAQETRSFRVDAALMNYRAARETTCLGVDAARMNYRAAGETTNSTEAGESIHAMAAVNQVMRTPPASLEQ